MASRRTLLIFSQSYPPDPMSVGQHLADVAREMSRRGHRVLVVTANRGYDDPTIVYPARETIDGVEVRRLALSSFGKKRLGHRAAAAALFVAQCAAIGVSRGDVDVVLVSTVPPLGATAALLTRYLRRVPTVYWVMDVNPDQLIATGAIAPNSLAARALARLSSILLSSASKVVPLDRFMAARLEEAAPIADRIEIIPPWPHEDQLASVNADSNPFLRSLGLTGQRVVMYSGNHSPSHPLRTLLEAAARLRDDPRLVFVFVGGGQGKGEVERFTAEHQLANVRLLPYQPLSQIRYSLSAADVHVVSLGERFVGINHPCKAYGSMAVARPILYFGPRPSHITDLLDRHSFGWQVSHGDVDGATEALRGIATAASDKLTAMGLIARTAADDLRQSVLCGRLCDGIERAVLTD